MSITVGVAISVAINVTVRLMS